MTDIFTKNTSVQIQDKLGEKLVENMQKVRFELDEVQYGENVGGQTKGDILNHMFDEQTDEIGVDLV